MKETIKNFTSFTFIFLFFYFTIKYNIKIQEQILYSAKLWLTKIVPTLFPTFIILDLIKTSKIPQILSKYHINYIYLLSIISGSPSNAYMLKNYKTDLTKILATTNYTSFLFTYTSLKTIYNTNFSLILLFFNILANFILIKFIKPNYLDFTYNEKSMLKTLLDSIKNSTNSIIYILGTIIFFSILPIFTINNLYLKTIIYCVFEITQGFNYLSTTNFPLLFKVMCTCLILSSSGLCIQFQIKSIISDAQIKTLNYIKYRIFHFFILIFLTSIYLVLCY